MEKQNRILLFFYILIGFVILFLGYNYYVYRNKFTLDRKNYTISIDAKYKMILYGYKGKIQKNTNFKYKVDDESIVTIDENGTIIPKKIGKTEATIISKHGDNKRKTIINVVNDSAKSITLNKSSIIMNIGNKDKIKFVINNDQNLIYNAVYSSSNPDIVSVDQDGTIEALDGGRAIISVSTSNGLTSECYVIVLGKKSSKNSNNKIKDNVRTSDKNSNKESNNNNSNNENTSNNNNDNNDDNNNNDNNVEPEEPEEPKDILPTGIKLDSKSIDIKKGSTSTITAVVLPITSTNKSVKWKSSNESVVTVDDDGKISAKNYGSATVTATTVNNKTASVVVNVKKENIEVTGIKLSKISAIVNVGSVVGIGSEVTPSNATNKSIIWTSSDTKIATVSNGVVRGIKAGVVTITATTNNGKKAVCLVTVKNVDPTGVSLNTTNRTIYIGEKFDLIATLYPSNVTFKNVTWSSSNDNVAKVSNGVVSGLKEGTTTITVKTINNLTAKCTVKVISKNTKIPVVGITLNKTNMTLIEGNSYTLKATINPSNATNKGVKWTSSNTSVATVSSSGVVKAINAGTATITATSVDGNKKASSTLTVKKVNLIASYFLNTTTNPNFSKSLKSNNAFIFKTINNKYILVDTGIKAASIKNLIYNKLKSLQGTNSVTIDYMIISHFDGDHYGNAASIISDNKIKVKELIMKKESHKLKTSSYKTKYDEIISAAKSEKATITLANEKGSTIEYALDNNVKMYIFNTKDVYSGNSKCSSYDDAGSDYALNYVKYTKDTSSIAKDTNGNYIYIEGSDFLSNGNKVKIKTSSTVKFNQNSSTPMKSRFYAVYFKNNNCRSNAQSMPVVFQVKTKNGNKYTFVPGDLENNGYYPFGEYDSNYGTTIHGVVSSYYPQYKMVGKEPRFIVSNNSYKKSSVTPTVKVPSDYKVARDMVNKFGDIKGNITIFQEAHHGLNNSPEMISTLGLNKGSVYSITPVGSDPRTSNSIRSLMSSYYLRNSKIMFTGGNKQGIKCVINSSGQTSCSSY